MLRSLTASLAILLALAGQARAATVQVLVLKPDGKPVADAAVVLEPLSPFHSRGHARATIEQRGREFIPYVTVVKTGSAIDFPNNDTVRHHVYSFSSAKRFEIKLYAGKPGTPIIFDKAGEVVIGCNIHDWMEAYVLVVDSPYFGKTGGDGRATIPSLPAGRYRLHLWHPLQKSRPAPSEIDIKGSPAKLKLVLDVAPRELKPRSEAEPDHY
jgi:plastocyanin